MTLAWKREVRPLIWDSQYDSTDDNGDRFRIVRNRRTRSISLTIWRGRAFASETFKHIPSVRLAKKFAETRRAGFGLTW